jgi:hypothetical protein
MATSTPAQDGLGQQQGEQNFRNEDHFGRPAQPAEPTKKMNWLAIGLGILTASLLMIILIMAFSKPAATSAQFPTTAVPLTSSTAAEDLGRRITLDEMQKAAILKAQQGIEDALKQTKDLQAAANELRKQQVEAQKAVATSAARAVDAAEKYASRPAPRPVVVIREVQAPAVVAAATSATAVPQAATATQTQSRTCSVSVNGAMKYNFLILGPQNPAGFVPTTGAECAKLRAEWAMK